MTNPTAAAINLADPANHDELAAFVQNLPAGQLETLVQNFDDRLSLAEHQAVLNYILADEANRTKLPKPIRTIADGAFKRLQARFSTELPR